MMQDGLFYHPTGMVLMDGFDDPEDVAASGPDPEGNSGGFGQEGGSDDEEGDPLFEEVGEEAAEDGHGDVDGGEPETGQEFGSETSGFDTSRFHVHVSSIPGFDLGWLGAESNPIPLIQVGTSGDTWVNWTESYDRVVPARVMCINLPLWLFDPDAELGSDWRNHASPMQQVRAQYTAQLLGMLSVSTCKGFVNGNHIEIEDLVRGGTERNAAIAQLEGAISSHIYYHNTSDDGTDVGGVIPAPMFGWCIEVLYDEKWKEPVAYRAIKLVYDKGHSDTYLFHKLMDENRDRYNHSSANNMANAHRKDSSSRTQTRQREMGDPNHLDKYAATQHFRCTDEQALNRAYRMYEAGSLDQSSVDPSLHLTDWGSLPYGTNIHKFSKMWHEKMGGISPLSPEGMLNMQRPEAGRANLVGETNAPLPVNSIQKNTSNYFTWCAERNGYVFAPPAEVIKHDAMYICTKMQDYNIFSVKLPRRLHTGMKPNDALLRVCFDVFSRSNSQIRSVVGSLERSREMDGRLELDRAKERADREFEQTNTTPAGPQRDAELLAARNAAEKKVRPCRKVTAMDIKAELEKFYINYVSKNDAIAQNIAVQVREDSCYRSDSYDLTDAQKNTLKNTSRVYKNGTDEREKRRTLRCHPTIPSARTPKRSMRGTRFAGNGLLPRRPCPSAFSTRTWRSCTKTTPFCVRSPLAGRTPKSFLRLPTLSSLGRPSSAWRRSKARTDCEARR